MKITKRKKAVNYTFHDRQYERTIDSEYLYTWNVVNIVLETIYDDVHAAIYPTIILNIRDRLNDNT